MVARIDALAQSRGTSRNKLLEACGARSYVDNLKKGQVPKVDTTMKIADHYNVSVDYILCRTDIQAIAQTKATPQHSATALKIASAYDKAQPSIQAAARAMFGIEEDVSSARVPIQYAARGGATGSGTVDAALAAKHKKTAKEVLENQKDDFDD